MNARKRKCSICPRADETTRKFPANSREFAQVQWIERLGMSAEETREKLTEYRERIEQGVDIRWCSDHFASPNGLPRDLRSNPNAPLQFCQLRKELQFDRLQERYRKPVASSPTVSDVEIDQDEAVEGTPPPNLSPIHRPSSPLHLDSSLSFSGQDDDLYNNIDQNLPALFRKQSSIRTEGGATTIQESEYIPTAESQRGSDESECEEVNEKGDNIMRKYRIVTHEQLLKLFRFCQECGGIIDKSLTTIRNQGSACIVEYSCLGCGIGTWQSQGRIGKGMSTVYEGDQELAISTFITGVPLPRLIDCAEVFDLALPTERSMRRTIRDIACPAIDNVFTQWQTHVRNVSKDVGGPNGIAVSIDGQYDTPGFNASNCKVTVIDANLKLALAGVSLHKKEPGIDGVSIRMESVGALRAMKELVDDQFVIQTRVTDSNTMVDKKLREDPQTASIVAQIDWWHTQKSLKKEWWKSVKIYPVLGQLYQGFFNHLFYCHKKYPKDEDRPKALEFARSFLMHVQGKHSWKTGDKFAIVTKCDHSKLKRRKKGEPPKPKLKPTSMEYKMIEEMLYSKSFEKKFLKSSSLIDTALNESYHALSLLYAPKRLACGPFIYNIKMKLSMLHYNSLILHEMMGLRRETRAFLLQRPGRMAISVKTKREAGKHPWREEILREGERVREDLEEGRLMRRIGMPTDLVFDEITTWHANRKGVIADGNDFSEEEDGEDEVFGEGEEENEWDDEEYSYQY